MPVKKTHTKHSKSKSGSSYPALHFFSGSRLKLEVIIITFLALSALLLAHIASQQEEINVYRSAQAQVKAK